MKTRRSKKDESLDDADAITFEDLVQVMRWSEGQCPPKLLSGGAVVGSGEETYLIAEHGLMRAFMSTGFALWTRNFELCKLRAQDITWNCIEQPFNIPYFEVRLENREGWGKKVRENGPLEGHAYWIYKQDVPAIDAYTHLPAWVNYMQQRLGRNLLPTDYIFPDLSVDGTIRANRAMSHDNVQDLLTMFTASAGLTGHFATHSLRCGGVQYRFTREPIGICWSLSKVRWWGGWADNENNDTLTRYLLNSPPEDHSDALCPVRAEPEPSMGENRRTAILDAILDAVRASMTNLPRANPIQVPLLPPPSNGAAACSASSASSTSTINWSGGPASTNATHPGPSTQAACAPQDNTSATHGVHPNDVAGSQRTNASIEQGTGPSPQPGVRIQDLMGGPDAWRTAIQQWDGDPDTGVLGLKDWPREWYSGAMGKMTATKRSTRQLVALEFEKFGRDEVAFMSAYPEASRGFGELLTAIRRKNGRQRNSRNGTPEEHKRERQRPARFNPY
ncbi:hypothetical protein AX17_001665 [Amanita inopinata Kibby_2008]|nr:hypothetical protein AX17_001665 [Amanita inopinata Kibby_2008]